MVKRKEARCLLASSFFLFVWESADCGHSTKFFQSAEAQRAIDAAFFGAGIFRDFVAFNADCNVAAFSAGCIELEKQVAGDACGFGIEQQTGGFEAVGGFSGAGAKEMIEFGAVNTARDATTKAAAPISSAWHDKRRVSRFGIVDRCGGRVGKCFIHGVLEVSSVVGWHAVPGLDDEIAQIGAVGHHYVGFGSTV